MASWNNLPDPPRIRYVGATRRRKTTQRVIISLCASADDAAFMLRFLSMWFGRGTKLATVSRAEVEQVLKLVLG